MNREDIKVGATVKAIFRKYGKHIITGTVIEICSNEHALDGDWIGIKVISGDKKDAHVTWMIKNRVCCLVPLNDVKEIVCGEKNY